MRPSRIREAASALLEIMEDSEAVEVLEESVDGTGIPRERLLRASNFIARRLGEADPEVEWLATQVGAGRISNPDFWAPLLADESVDSEVSHGMLTEVTRAQEFLQTLMDLLEPSRGNRAPIPGMANFTLVLADTDGEARPAADIRDAVDSFQTLYSVGQVLDEINSEDDESQNGTPLKVSTAETGSELAFNFLGSASALTTVGTMLLAVWDRVQFSDESSLSSQMHVVSESVGVLDEIEEKKDRIGRKKAERMKRDVVDSVRDMLGVGAIPEQARETYQETAKQIASEATRALPEQADDDPPEEDLAEDDLAEDDLAEEDPVEEDLVNELPVEEHSDT